MGAKTPSSWSERLAISGLLLLALVPAIAGTNRIAGIAAGAEVTEANARFMAMPLPVVLHILGAIPYSILGALQFAPTFRRRNRALHRALGRVLGVCGLAVALSGLWMAHNYPWPEGDGYVLYLQRLVFGTAMVWALVAGIDAVVRRRDLDAHGAWMLRAYAIGMGAGTQVLTHLPFFILVGKPGEFGRNVMMGLGWLINIAVAEWLIHRRRTLPRPVRRPAPRVPEAANRRLHSRQAVAPEAGLR